LAPRWQEVSAAPRWGEVSAAQRRTTPRGGESEVSAARR